MSEEDKNSHKIGVGFVYELEKVFKSYYAPLCYFASKFFPDGAEAEDIVQDLFVGLAEKKQRFESEYHLKNFLYLSVRNASISRIRKGNTKEKYLAFFQEKQLNENLEEAVITTEIYKELAEAVDKLPAECRKVFELTYFQGLSNEEVALRLNLSIHTVKAQKARGKKILKENLRHLYPLFFIFLGIDRFI